MSRASLLLAAVPLLLLAGCGTDLPSKEGEAFGKVAGADSSAFSAEVAQAQQLVRARAVLELKANRGVIVVDGDGCTTISLLPVDPAGPAPPGPPRAAPGTPRCRVYLQQGAQKDYLETDAPKVRKLLAAIAEYGANVTTLSAAKDLVDAQKAVDGVATAAKAIGTALGQPEAIIAIDAAQMFDKYRLRESRRKLLLATARQMQQPIERATEALNNITGPLSDRMVTATIGRANFDYKNIADTDTAEDTLRKLPDCKEPCANHAADLAVLRSRREAAATDLIKAADDLNAARALSANFKSLAQAHQTYLDALEYPGPAKAETVLEQASAWSGLVSDVATAAK